VVRVGKFTGTKGGQKRRQTQGGSVTDKLRSILKPCNGWPGSLRFYRSQYSLSN